MPAAYPLFIRGATINETVYNAIKAIMENGSEIETRNGSAKFLNDLTLQIDDPRQRHLSLKGRTSNIFQMMAETFWVMAGHSQVYNYLNFFLPRAVNYSDDGKTWHGAYGPRLYCYNQMEDLRATFVREGKSTRRAILMIADPSIDNLDYIRSTYQSETPKDIPCNREIHFYITDNEFHCKVIQRSGDMIFGTGSINPFEFTFLQECIYTRLIELPGFEDVKLGHYRWHVTNAHIYSDHFQQAENIITSHQVLEARDSEVMSMKCLYNREEMHEIITEVENLISIPNPDFLIEKVKNLYPMSDFVEPIELYRLLVRTYAIAKRLKTLKSDKKLVLQLPTINNDLYYAITESTFLNFEIVHGSYTKYIFKPSDSIGA
ncbi:deoxyuridylate hydroxymethyltransferase [Acinetobacter phage SH-Ab 15599]|nr:deoxyuridylate hydroxymethyltransferase [Acinetobacter phage SH-Ab 15599]